MCSQLSRFTLFGLSLLACSGDSVSQVDSGVHVDSSVDAHPCTASATYAPTFDSNSSAATNYPHGTYSTSVDPHIETFGGLLNGDPSPDFLDLELWGMAGGFGSGDVTTGTFTLTGADIDYGSCGICLAIGTDAMGFGSNAQFTDIYMAQSGSVTITSVGTNGSGTLSGSISNVQFAHVSFAGNHQTLVGDCTSTIASASFSAPLGGKTGLFTGKLDHRLPIVLHQRWR